MTAVVGTAFDATVSKEVRRRLVNAKALADIILVPTPDANDVALQVVVREPVGPSCPRGVDAPVLGSGACRGGRASLRELLLGGAG
jgi:hypothetical protein